VQLPTSHPYYLLHTNCRPISDCVWCGWLHGSVGAGPGKPKGRERICACTRFVWARPQEGRTTK